MKSIFLLPLVYTFALADFVEKDVTYQIGDTEFAGKLIYEANEGSDPLPGIAFFPNWMGPATEASHEKAREIAEGGFAVFIADMYGVDIRPKNGGEAGKAAGFVRADRELMRARASKAIEVFDSLATNHPIDTEKTIAIGFCFGGGAVLELARSGTDTIEGVVSFHGDLKSPTLESDAAQVKIPQLVLHGADDPYVPQTDVQTWIDTMQKAEVDDWNLVQFSNTVHSFTDPTAKSKGAHYNERTAQRAFEMMEDYAAEWLELKK
ncbi:MAG: dienelactone hydrolase family protein [Opitutaceae bacterium]